ARSRARSIVAAAAAVVAAAAAVTAPASSSISAPTAIAATAPTAIAAAVIAAAAAIAAPAATAAASGSSRSGLVDGEASALVVAAVEVLDGSVGLVVIFHLDEAEASTPPRLAVAQDLSRPDRTVLLEHLLKMIRRDRIGQIPDVKPFRHRTCLGQ